MTRRIRYSLLLLPAVLILTWVLVMHSTWGLSLALRFVSLYLPGELTVTGTQGSLAGPLTLTGIQYRQGELKVSAESIYFDWRSAALLSGRLSVSELAMRQINIELADTHHQEQVAQQIIVLPLAIDIERAQLEGLRINRADSDQPLVINAVRLAGSAEAQDIRIHELHVDGYGAQLHSKGNLSLAAGYPLDLQVAFSYTLPDSQIIQGAGFLQGNLQTMRLQQKLSGPLSVNFDMLAMNIDTELKWQADVQIEKLNAVNFDKSWPDVEVAGHLNPAGDLQQFRLSGALQLEEQQTGRAEIEVVAQSDYLLTDYSFDLKGDFTGIDLPAATFRVAGAGTHKDITIPQLAMSTLQGDIKGDAKIAWHPKLRINSDLTIHNIETSWLHRDWPGQLDARLTIRSVQQEAATRINFRISELSGTLREHSLAGKAHGAWYENGLLLDEMDLNVGDGQFHASGNLTEQWNLKFNISMPDLEQLLPDSSGKLDLHGHVRGSRASPLLSLQAKAENLHYAGYSSGQLAINADLGLSRQDRIYLDFQASDVDLPVGQWQSLNVQASGTSGAHKLILDARNQQTTLHAMLGGAASGWQWQAILHEFLLAQNEIGTWQLRERAQLSLNRSSLTVSQLCLEQDKAYLCSELRWQEKQPSAKLEGYHIPLGMLNTWIPADIRTAGLINVKGSLHGEDIQHFNANFELTSVGETLHVDFDDPADRLTLGPSTLYATVDNNGMSASLNMSIVPGGGIEAEINAPGWTMGNGNYRNQLFKGRFSLTKLPAHFVTYFIPDLVSAEGFIDADMSFAGTTREPGIAGTARWHDGSMLIPELGINIVNIRAELASVQKNIVMFDVTARSGEGDVRLSGQTRLDQVQGWPTQARLTSTKLEVMNTPEAYVVVDSDIDLSSQGNTIDITGDLSVPRARLRPRQLPEGTATVSKDVMIISEEDQAERTEPWRVTSRIRVKLGELVDFDGFGVSGMLRGNLLLIDEPGKPVVGQGDISIADGIYRLRGQDLSISRGRLHYANSFIDNPGIDVEATRSIETVLVGVRIKGTLKQPTLTIFSEPAMSQTDALSYLILGHSLAQGTADAGESTRNTAAAVGFFAGDLLARDIGGQLGLDELRVDVGETTEKTSLVMGKYLSSKLYVRYLSGIVESSNIIQLRYQLSPRVQIQTEGGYRGSQSVTGGDIFFTIQY